MTMNATTPRTEHDAYHLLLDVLDNLPGPRGQTDCDWYEIEAAHLERARRCPPPATESQPTAGAPCRTSAAVPRIAAKARVRARREAIAPGFIIASA